jgi:bla regulator protein BlaR1
VTPLRLLETMVSLSLHVTLIVAATGFLSRRACRSEPARDALWCGCLAALLLVTLGDLGSPHLRLLPVPAAMLGPAARLIIEPLATAGSWLVAIWMAGVAFVLGRLIVGFVRGVRLVKRTTVIPSSQLPEPWGRLPVTGVPVEAPHERQSARFLSTQEMVSPFCWQLQRATIVLPEVVLAFPADQIAAVIRHELAHLRFRHPLWLFVQRLVEALLWFHPAVRRAARQASQTREFACDASAAATPEAAASLLRALLRLSGLSCRRPRSYLASAATGDIAGILSVRAHKLAGHDRAPPVQVRRSFWGLIPIGLAMAMMPLVWITIDVAASARSAWSPWPSWSAQALQGLGIRARDYEIDAHRLRPHRHDS